jgi:hypothetical protein
MGVGALSARGGSVASWAGEKQHARLILALLFLTGAAVLPYIFVPSQPFISDDYVQVALGRKYGPVSGWTALAEDVLYRARATSLVLTYWTERFFGFSPEPFYVSAILLHVLNTWLVFRLGCRLGMGRRVALFAAAFFAIYEGHQEAVMWYAALPELLVFFFSLSALLLWSLWLACGSRRAVYYVAALACFCLAMISKESAVVVVPLLLVAAWKERRGWAWITPFAVLAAGYTWMTFAGQDRHLHFNDAGTFSLAAPFWLTLLNSYARLLWIWGLLSLVALVAWRARRYWRTAALGAVWIVIALLPYSFLTYMPRVPSRHTYLASAGLAWMVGAGCVAFHRRFQVHSRWPAYVLAAVMLAHNCGYVWVKKKAQFLERALPTEALVDLARQTDGPIYVRCFPYTQNIAELAVQMRLGKPPESVIWAKRGSEFSRACLEEGEALPLRASFPEPPLQSAQQRP